MQIVRSLSTLTTPCRFVFPQPKYTIKFHQLYLSKTAHNEKVC